jgi:BirA family biotin operon repressor/biotin-[acetyl-CoA-carboxylase] ligase
MISGLSVCDAVEAQTGLRPGLKWPNDVVVCGAKLGGILTEIEIQDSKLEYAIVGIGLNVSLDLSQLPKDLLMRATSLYNELGQPVSRLQLLWAFLLSFEERYFSLEGGHSPHIEWSQRLTTLGQPVIVTSNSTAFEGVAEGVDRNGALLVRRASGELETILAGDVTLRFGQTGSDLL